MDTYNKKYDLQSEGITYRWYISNLSCWRSNLHGGKIESPVRPTYFQHPHPYFMLLPLHDRPKMAVLVRTMLGENETKQFHAKKCSLIAPNGTVLWHIDDIPERPPYPTEYKFSPRMLNLYLNFSFKELLQRIRPSTDAGFKDQVLVEVEYLRGGGKTIELRTQIQALDFKVPEGWAPLDNNTWQPALPANGCLSLEGCVLNGKPQFRLLVFAEKPCWVAVDTCKGKEPKRIERTIRDESPCYVRGRHYSPRFEDSLPKNGVPESQLVVSATGLA